ncbi:HNH endonuclease [Peribacillus sp. NPDC097675]|uniref:HNH endonuclease n=1 Tax=Peribacillus sp. NPDC097675 TaxID=3390618 RepID=UPI003CFE4231
MTIMKPCSKVGCSQTVPRGQQPPYCDYHKTKANKEYDMNKRDPKRTAFYKGMSWRNLRRSVLVENFHICSMCGEFGNTVHHIKPISTQEGWERRLDRSNLTVVCWICHAKIHDEKSPFFHK